MIFIKVCSWACVGVHFRGLSWFEPHDSFKVNEKVTVRMACDNLKIYPLLPLQVFCVTCYGNKWFSAWGWLKGVLLLETELVFSSWSLNNVISISRVSFEHQQTLWPGSLELHQCQWTNNLYFHIVSLKRNWTNIPLLFALLYITFTVATPKISRPVLFKVL